MSDYIKYISWGDNVVEAVGSLIFTGCALLKPVKAILNDPYTIVIFNDGSKEVVKAHNEPFDGEKGIAMAIVRRFLPNRSEFQRLVDTASVQTKE